jgi:hypothetical protein
MPGFKIATISSMFPRVAYRQFHDQTNIAAATTVLLAEFGLAELDTSRPRQELTLNGLLQRGVFEEDRGLLLRNALKHLAVAGLHWTLLHDAVRTSLIEARVRSYVPDFRLRFVSDLNSPADAGLHLESALAGGARLLLVEARHSLRGLPMHVLLIRREGDLYYAMNSHTGQDYAYELQQLSAHIATPVSAGAVSFSGSQYLYTGIAVRIWRQ